MAKYKVLSADSKHGIYEFLVDKVSDLNLLPKKTGSTAFVINDNTKYICSNAKEWKILLSDSNDNTQPDSGSGDGSNNTNQLEIIIMYHDSPDPTLLEEIYMDEIAINPPSSDDGIYRIDVPAGSRMYLVLNNQFPVVNYNSSSLTVFSGTDGQMTYYVTTDGANQNFIMPNTDSIYYINLGGGIS